MNHDIWFTFCDVCHRRPEQKYSIPLFQLHSDGVVLPCRDCYLRDIERLSTGEVGKAPVPSVYHFTPLEEVPVFFLSFFRFPSSISLIISSVNLIPSLIIR